MAAGVRFELTEPFGSPLFESGTLNLSDNQPYGGECGIRTHGGDGYPSPVFKTGSLNRSDNSPYIFV